MVVFKNTLAFFSLLKLKILKTKVLNKEHGLVMSISTTLAFFHQLLNQIKEDCNPKAIANRILKE